jgi:hypothetical protein
MPRKAFALLVLAVLAAGLAASAPAADAAPLTVMLGVDDATPTRPAPPTSSAATG